MSKANDKIIATLFDNIEKDGLMPWQTPYIGGGLPHNHITGRVYSGRNLVVLMSMRFNQSGFMTFKQAQDAGGSVRKGSSGIPVIYATPGLLVESENVSDAPKRVGGGMRLYYVFNVSSIDNMPESVPVIGDNIGVESFIENLPVTWNYGKRPSYSLTKDTVNMPRAGDFEVMDEYYSTVFHELIHWTGESSRLNRFLTGDHNDEKYCYEELVAEIGSAFLRCKFGIENKVSDEQNAAYVKGWLSLIGDDKEMILKAATEAQKAMDYLLTFSNEKE